MTYEEYKRKYQQKKINSEKEDDSNGGYYDRYLEQYGGGASDGSQYDLQTRLESFGKDFDSFVASAQESSKNMGYNTAKTAWETHSTKASDLQSRASDLKLYLSAHRDLIGDDAYNQYWDYLVSANNYLTNASNYFNKNMRHYSGYETEEDYNNAVMGWLNPDAPTNEKTVAQRKEKYENNKKRIKELEDSMPWYADAWLVPDTVAQWFMDDDGDARLEELNKLRAENEKYDQEQGTLDSYYVPQTDEFLANAAYRDYSNASKDELWEYDMSVSEGSLALNNGGDYDEDGNIRNKDGEIVQYANPPAVEDKLGMYLSSTPEERADAENRRLATNSNYKDTWADYIHEGWYNSWEELTPDEINIYYDLYKREGQAAAYKFLDDMTLVLNKRSNAAEQEMLANASTGELIAYNLLSVPSNVFGGAFAFVDDTVNYIQGEEINPYSKAHTLTNFSVNVRGETDNRIVESTDGAALPWVGTTWGDVYQSLMSTADSVLGRAVGGTGYGVLMGMGAASNEMKDLYEQGASQDQIYWGGVLAGAAEMVFEKYSMDKWVKMGDAKTIKGLVINTLKQGGVELSEEAFTEIANTITNVIVMGTESDWVDVTTFAKNVVNSGISGFISGSASGGGASTASYSRYNINATKTGQTITNTDGGIQALKDLANEVAGVSSEKVQKRLQKQAGKVTDSTGRRNANRVGRLLDNVRDANNIANVSHNQADVAKSLERNDFDSKTANAIARAMVAQANGQPLSDRQSRLLKKYKDNADVQSARRNIVANEMSTMGQRSQNIRAFETDIAIGMLQKQLEAKAKETIKKQYTEKEFTPEGKFEVATEGKVIDKDGNLIDIKGVASISSEGMHLDIGDGKTVKASEVSYSSKDDALIYEAVENLGDKIDYDTANKLIGQYKGGNAQLFARGITQAYTYGYHGIAQSELTGKLASGLSREQINAAYKLGKDYRPVKDQNDATISKLKSRPGEKGVFYRDKDGTATDIRTWMNENGHGLKDIQKTGIDMMEKMSKMLGVRFNVFESWTENGKTYYLDQYGQKREGDPNGFYDPRTGEIYIDLHAGNNFEGTMLFTVAHELTHFMRQWSPAQFTEIAKIIFQHGKMKGSVTELLALKQAKAKAKGKPVSYDTAMEELVADGMETVLKDGKVVEFMADVKKQDQRLWAKLKEWFQNLAEFLKEMVTAYSSYSAQSTEGARVAEFSQKLLNQIEQIWAKGALEAGKNYQKAQNASVEKAGNQSTKFSNRQSEKNSLATEETVKYSNRKNFFPSNVFPPYNESHSDSHEVAERWARSEEGRTEKQRLLSHHGKWYVIQVVDDMDYGYQIIRGLTAEEYKREEKFYGTITRHQSVSDIARRNVTRHRGTNRNDEAGYRTDSGQSEHRGKNISVFGVDTDQDGRRKAESNEIGDNRSSGENRERRNEPSVKMRRLDELGARAKWLREKIKSDRVSREKKSEYRKELRKVQNEMEELMPGYYPSGSDTKMSDRDTESVSNRSLLANAFEGIITNPIEKKKLQEYKEQVALLDEQEQKLRELNAQIKELSFGKGPRDKTKIAALRDETVKTANRIAIYDKRIFGLEAATPLQNILKREREIVRKRERQKGKEALAEQRAAMEAKQKETIDKWRENRKTAVAKARDTAEKRDARAKLQKLVLDTVKWISYPAKTDVKCPDILKKPYADFLNGIDLSSKRLADGGDATKNDLRLANAMDSLATALDKIMISQDPSQDVDNVLDTGYLDLPADFVQKLRDMTEGIKSMMVEGEYVVNTMTATEVRQLSQMIRTLNHAIKTMSKLYANLRFANIEALGFDTMEFIDALGEIEKTGGMKDFVQWDNALPYYAFKRFGKGGESVFEGLMDAQDKLAFLAQEIFNFRNKAWNDKEAKAWSEDTHTIDLPNGNKLTLTTADAMSIYCLSRREQGLQHLLGGGTRVIGIQKGSKKAKDSRSVLTIKDIDAIISSLTDRKKKVADDIQAFMSTVCSEWGNEVSMKRFLTKEFNEKFYFPIESNDENLPTKDPAAQQSDLFRLLNISATKPITPGANNEVIIRNIFDVFSSHASDMARLNAYGMPLLDYMKWLNYREKTVNEEGQINVRGVRKSIEKAFGNAANSYVLNLVKDVNGRPSDGGEPNILMKWMRNAKTASVGSSLRVATLQITSYPRAALVLSPKSLALGLTKIPNIKRAKQYCGIALWKSFGFYDTNISRSIEDQMKGVTNIRQKLIELSLKGAEWGDAITWGALWNACEYEVAKTTKNKVGSEEFYQEVGKKLREVVYRTQVVDSTLTRSQIMRSKRGMAQEAAAFMSEPTLSANILMDAGFQFSMEKRRSGSAKAAWKMTGKYIGRAVAVYSIGQLAAALLEGLWDAWRDDEDEEFSEKYWDAFAENLVLDLVPFNKIPIVSDVFEAVLAMFDVGFYSSDKMSTTWLTQAVSAVDAWKSALSDESSTTTYNALYKTTRAISSFFGVSFSGVMREGVALWNNTAGAYDSTLKIRLSSGDLGNNLYEAIIAGDTRQADSLKAQFEDQDSMHSAVRKALRENDPRIKEAAQAQINGDPSERVRIAYLIVADGFNQDDVVAAINAEINAMTPDNGSADTKKAKGLYTTDDFATEIANGDQAAAYAAKDNIIQTAQKNGKSKEDAEKSFNSSAKAALKEQFLAGNISEQETINALTTFCGIDEQDAMSDVQYWAFRQEYPEVFADDQWFDTYYEKIAYSGISIDVYMGYREKVSTITGEGKKEKRMAVIHSLPITSAQKDALYFAEGWAESKLYEAPWH